MSSMSAYFATVFRLTWSTRAISDLERPAASIDRISFTVSRGTVISSILPGRARQSCRPGKPYGEGRAPGPRGAALLLKLLNFSCSRCLFPSDHSDHFLVNINTSIPIPDIEVFRTGRGSEIVQGRGEIGVGHGRSRSRGFGGWSVGGGRVISTGPKRSSSR